MSNEYVKSKLGDGACIFEGTVDELEQFMQSCGISFSYMVANYGTVYFVTQGELPVDARIREMT